MPKDIVIPVEIGGVKFKNPFFVASGPTTKSVPQLLKIEKAGWAAASIKLTIDPAPYINRSPRYAIFNDRNALAFTAEKRLNFEQGLKLVKDAKKVLKDLILFANITYAGDKGVEGWVNMAKKFEEAGADIVELNMCCPNMSYNLELTCGDKCASNVRTGASLGQQEDKVSEIVREIKKSINIPLFVKLTPEGGRIAKVASTLYKAGADAVGGTANRLGIPLIDLENPGKAVYHLQDEISMSCHCGSWLKPLAQRDTYEIRKVNGPDHRIMAAGGVRNYKDAIEMIMCGADLVGICTETLISGYDFIGDEIKNLKNWMDEHGYKDLREIRDLVVPKVKTAPELTLYKGYANIKEPNLAGPCKAACPMHVPVQAYVRKVAKKEYREAFDLITGAAPLQSICGYVCDHPCEDECTRGEHGNPIRIKDIKRFVLEYGKDKGWEAKQTIAEPNGKKAAVIGSGPAGISNAYYLAKAGYDVTIFEKDERLGGSLKLIPSFRLPCGALDDEIKTLKDMGVKIKTNCELGKDITIESLKKDGFDAIFLGMGIKKDNLLTEKGNLLTVPNKIWNFYDFLKEVNSGEMVEIGDKTVVIGGGNEALDSARCALRLGSKNVYVVFSGTKDEMKVDIRDIEMSENEGIKFMYSMVPLNIENKNNNVSSIRINSRIVNELNAEFSLPCDTVVMADKLISDLTKIGIEKVNRETLSTNIPGVYSCTAGTDSVISSVLEGINAAASMDKYLLKDKASIEYIAEVPVADKESVLKRTGFYKDTEELNLETASGQERIKNFELCERTMTEEEAVKEAERCLSCGCGEGCNLCRTICSEFAVYKSKPDTIKINNKACVACGMCFNRCPNKNIEMINTGEKI